MIKRVVVTVVVVAVVLGVVWQYRKARMEPPPDAEQAATGTEAQWLDQLYSQNPREVEAASRTVSSLGEEAVPVIRSTLKDPNAEAVRLKAALKAISILGPTAAPAIPEVAAVLREPGLTAEAALALSYLGPGALRPLSEALSDDDPIVRRESLRSIGKLKERAKLPGETVVPMLIETMEDGDPGVRAVAATYLGIVADRAHAAVPALINGLSDADPEVRRVSASALSSFGPAAAPALPALKRASKDPNDDVAREAGRAVVKLQQK